MKFKINDKLDLFLVGIWIIVAAILIATVVLFVLLTIIDSLSQTGLLIVILLLFIYIAIHIRRMRAIKNDEPFFKGWWF